MHVAATNPVALDAAGVDPATIEREKADAAREERRQARPRASQKIVESGLKSYYKEVTPARAGLRPRAVEDRRAGAEGSRGRRSARRSRIRASSAMRSARASRRRGERLRRRGGRSRRPGLRRLSRDGGACSRRFRIATPGSQEGARDDRTRSRRVLVKLSGEALMAPDGYWLNPQTLRRSPRTRPGGQRRVRDRRRHRRRQRHPRRPHERGRLDRPGDRRFHGHARRR